MGLRISAMTSRMIFMSFISVGCTGLIFVAISLPPCGLYCYNSIFVVFRPRLYYCTGTQGASIFPEKSDKCHKKVRRKKGVEKKSDTIKGYFYL